MPIDTAYLYCARHLVDMSMLRHASSAAQSKKLNKMYSSADGRCVNLVWEYFCGMHGDPHFFLVDHNFPSDSFHYKKKLK